MEKWKDIKGYEGYYQVSNSGRVKSLKRTCKTKWETDRIVPEKILAQKLDKYGYFCLHLSKDNKRYYPTVHILVAQAFVDNPDGKPQVNHKDGDKQNNNDWNLEWATNRENIIHSYKEGLHIPRRGTARAISKMTDELVLEARKRYSEGGISIVNLAKDYPVCPQTLHSILLKKTWNHI